MKGSNPALLLPLLLSGFLTGIAMPSDATVRIPLDVDADGTGWTRVTLPNTPAVQFETRKDGSLATNTMGAFGMVYRALPKFEQLPQISWRWRVDKSLPATDATRKGGDDRPIAVHIWFPLPADTDGFWNSIGKGISSLLGAPPAGRVITYMWGGKHRTGDSFRNPHLVDHGRIIVRQGEDAVLGVWLNEKIDVAGDYQRLFGGNAPPPAFIGISADSDDTGAISRAAIADITITPTASR